MTSIKHQVENERLYNQIGSGYALTRREDQASMRIF